MPILLKPICRFNSSHQSSSGIFLADTVANWFQNHREHKGPWIPKLILKKKKKNNAGGLMLLGLQNRYQSYSNQNVYPSSPLVSWRTLALIYLCVCFKAPNIWQMFCSCAFKNTVTTTLNWLWLDHENAPAAQMNWGKSDSKVVQSSGRVRFKPMTASTRPSCPSPSPKVTQVNLLLHWWCPAI